MAISSAGPNSPPAGRRAKAAVSTPTPETLHVFAAGDIHSMKLVRQSDDTDEDYASRERMYNKLLKL